LGFVVTVNVINLKKTMRNNVLKLLVVYLLMGTPLSFSTVQASQTPKSIGEVYQGGIVFYIAPNGKHGLIAALTDQSGSVPWSNVSVFNSGYKVTEATRDGVYTGAKNTEAIIKKELRDNTSGSFAAKVAADYKVQGDGVTLCTATNSHTKSTCYDDWYLPSKEELNLLYRQRAVVGGLDKAGYWSSTEDNSIYADYQDFKNGSKVNYNKDYALGVRAIRAY